MPEWPGMQIPVNHQALITTCGTTYNNFSMTNAGVIVTCHKIHFMPIPIMKVEVFLPQMAIKHNRVGAEYIGDVTAAIIICTWGDENSSFEGFYELLTSGQFLATISNETELFDDEFRCRDWLRDRLIN